MLSTYLRTGLRIGVSNIARIAVYRAFKRIGVYRRLLPVTNPVALGLSEQSFAESGDRRPGPFSTSPVREADDLLNGKASYFSAHVCEIDTPPDWFFDPFAKSRHPRRDSYWSDIKDFDNDVGDIKSVWEMSRFTWATVFARAWRASGDRRYGLALLHWTEDWWQRNPPNVGPNWMCGQESSIRLMNILVALYIAGLRTKGEPGLLAFIEAHCRRIDRTTIYAMAQQNNHIISESAALLIGGAWIAKHSSGDAALHGRRWARKGRRLLERKVKSLVSADGSFSQYSLTYHRLILDTLSLVEVLRQEVGEGPFSHEYYDRARAATQWLGAMIDPVSGDGPNLGANDGADPYRLAARPFRDFRHCLQLSSMLFMGGSSLEPGPWDEVAVWLGVIPKPRDRPHELQSSNALFSSGGFVTIRNNTGAFILLRAPTARFRPPHADALHLDLWVMGVNILRDGGTYSYADNSEIALMLASARGHNVPQFDGGDQMPRLGRFLYGRWVRVVGDYEVQTSLGGQRWTGSCTDAFGRRHQRTVMLKDSSLLVTDRLRGFQSKVVLRWHLAPGKWSWDQLSCLSDTHGQIRVHCDSPIRRVSLVTGWESRHYLEKSPVPVLEVEINRSPATVTTTISFRSS